MCLKHNNFDGSSLQFASSEVLQLGGNIINVIHLQTNILLRPSMDGEIVLKSVMSMDRLEGKPHFKRRRMSQTGLLWEPSGPGDEVGGDWMTKIG